MFLLGPRVPEHWENFDCWETRVGECVGIRCTIRIWKNLVMPSMGEELLALKEETAEVMG